MSGCAVGPWLRQGYPANRTVREEPAIELHPTGSLKSQAAACARLIQRLPADETVGVVLKDESGDFEAVSEVLRARGLEVGVAVPTTARTNPVRIEVELLVAALAGGYDAINRLKGQFEPTAISVLDLLEAVNDASSLTAGLDTYWEEAAVLDRILGNDSDRLFEATTGTPEQQAAIGYFQEVRSLANFLDTSPAMENGWADLRYHVESIGDEHWGARYNLDTDENSRVTLTSIMQLNRGYDHICVLDVSRSNYDEAPDPTPLLPPESPGWHAHPTVTTVTRADVKGTFQHVPDRAGPRNQYWAALHARQLGAAIEAADSTANLFCPTVEDEGAPASVLLQLKDALGLERFAHPLVRVVTQLREVVSNCEGDPDDALLTDLEGLAWTLDRAGPEVRQAVAEELDAAKESLEANE